MKEGSTRGTAIVDKEKSIAMAKPWAHRIDVGEGVYTPGVDKTQALDAIRMPDDLTGCSVLDIGANNGFYSFEAEERGAARVVAADWNSWVGVRAGFDKKYRPQRNCFDIAKKLRHSDVEGKCISVYDLSPETVGTFDLVLCLGVLYHLWHPMLALEKIHSVTDDMLILETATLNDGDERPMMEFTRDKYDGDPTNWWYPNEGCLLDMLYSVGFSNLEVMPRVYGNRVVVHAKK